jgi:hypothetical protein
MREGQAGRRYPLRLRFGHKERGAFVYHAGRGAADRAYKQPCSINHFDVKKRRLYGGGRGPFKKSAFFIHRTRIFYRIFLKKRISF